MATLKIICENCKKVIMQIDIKYATFDADSIDTFKRTNVYCESCYQSIITVKSRG